MNANAIAAQTAQAKADRLAADAAAHKREMQRHRRALRSAKKQLAELEVNCAKLGITIIIENDTAEEAQP